MHNTNTEVARASERAVLSKRMKDAHVTRTRTLPCTFYRVWKSLWNVHVLSGLEILVEQTTVTGEMRPRTHVSLGCR